MAELMMFQPGKAFMDSYNQGKAGNLAKIAMTDPTRRQSALADLAGLDPQTANSMKKEFDEQEKEQLKVFSTAFVNTQDDASRDRMWGQAKQMWRPRFQALGSDIPDDWRQAMPTIQALAGAGNQNTGVQSTFISGGKLHYLTRDGKPVNTNIEVDDRYTLEIDPLTGMPYRFGARRGVLEGVDGGNKTGPQPNPATQQAPPAGSGGIVFPEDVSGAAQRTGDIMQQVKTEIAQLVAQGVPVADATSQVTQKYARMHGLTMPPQGQQPAPVVQQPVAPPVVQQPIRQPSGYQGMSAAEKARAEAEAKARIEFQYAPQVEGAKAMAKAQVEGQTAPQIAGATTAAQEEARNRVAVSAKADARVRDANDILSVLDEVEKILPQATGSPGGYAVDSLLGTVGYATQGAEANAKLEIYSSELVRRVPRFEGPQSDADRQAYMVAAGDVANPAKPIKVRMAAVQTMRALQQKYATGGVQPTAGAPVKISTKQQYDALPSGTEYIGPDGKKARKK